MATQPNQSLTFRQHLVYFCSRFLAYGVPLLFFLVTASFYLKTYDSAQVKITFTQIGTTILLFVWLTKILLEGRWPFSKEDFVFVAPFVAFLASGIIAYIHTPFKVWSMEETLRRVFYMVIALITVAEMRSAERMKRLWRWLMAAAWVAIGYGLIQYIDSRWFRMPMNGIDPFIWRQAFGARVFSTFGNPNFYGNFLVIMTPLILASVLRNKGPLTRPFTILSVTLILILLIDKMQLGIFGGFDPSFRFVFYFLILAGIGAFFLLSFWRVGDSGALPAFLILFALLFLNLFSTETKGAWLGFTAATAVTLWLIIEYFLHLDERLVEGKTYLIFVGSLALGTAVTLGLMSMSFVIPLLKKQVDQIGFSILWIPTALGALAAVVNFIWVMRKPWNLKKVVYGGLILFVLIMGGGVLQFAKTRLLSVSFRLFTWISTWEMVRTEPILGNGIGTFKVIYPAYRRPQIIVLEGKSNTETDHSEDEYIEVWQDEGILGFGIFLWMIATALVCGFKLLGWYARLHPLEAENKRALLDIRSDPTSYEVLGILGAYIGALIHWFVDVSVRFVSSGIFSGLLPGLLVAYARNHQKTLVNEVRLSYERWIRVAVAGVWTVVMLYLRMELVPNTFIEGGDTGDGQIVFWIFLSGAAIFILLEMLEWGNHPDKVVPFEEQYPTPSSKLLPIRVLAILFLSIVTARAGMMFSEHFQADVHHNLAIFFSKQQVWTRGGKYDQMMGSLPPDIRKRYRETGGALEHYDAVVKKNKGFPMSLYFIGNVHNDRGSEYFGQALNARQKGDMDEANRLRDEALEELSLSEDSYNRTKKIAPNYVQTHHQMGLLDVKRAEIYRELGDPAMKAKVHDEYMEALKNFRTYWMLDPVFPPNYDRMAQILLMDGKYDEAITLYKEAVYYNDIVAKAINVTGYPERVTELQVSLAKVYMAKANAAAPDPFRIHRPELQDALDSLNSAVVNNPKNVEAWKLLGLINERLGNALNAQEAYRKALELNPKDPDLKRAGT